VAAANPFKPTFGVSPPLLVGRDGLIEDVTEALEGGPGSPGRATLYTGARGSGKTVLLNAVEDRARELGWEVVSETASPWLVNRITHEHLPGLLRELDPDVISRRLGGLNLPLGPLGSVGANWATIERHIEEAGLRNQLQLVTDLLGEADGGLLITVDEVHHRHIDELRELTTTVQRLFRENREVAFVGAGLASAVMDVVNDPVLTFLRRADRHHLGRVLELDVAQGIRQPIFEAGRAVGDDALDVMVRATGGYPFLIQLVGHYSWMQSKDRTEISVEDAAAGAQQARRRVGSLVYEPALADTSDIDRTFLVAMAQDDGPSKMADIQGRMGVDASYASQYRRRLIATELIESSSYGYVDFALPYLREYLRDEAASAGLVHAARAPAALPGGRPSLDRGRDNADAVVDEVEADVGLELSTVVEEEPYDQELHRGTDGDGSLGIDPDLSL